MLVVHNDLHINDETLIETKHDELDDSISESHSGDSSSDMDANDATNVNNTSDVIVGSDDVWFVASDVSAVEIGSSSVLANNYMLFVYCLLDLVVFRLCSTRSPPVDTALIHVFNLRFCMACPLQLWPLWMCHTYLWFELTNTKLNHTMDHGSLHVA